MKPVVSLLVASTVGLSFALAEVNQASSSEVPLIAQARDPRNETGDDVDRMPVDRSQIKDTSGKNTWIPFG